MTHPGFCNNTFRVYNDNSGVNSLRNTDQGCVSTDMQKKKHLAEGKYLKYE